MSQYDPPHSFFIVMHSLFNILTNARIDIRSAYRTLFSLALKRNHQRKGTKRLSRKALAEFNISCEEITQEKEGQSGNLSWENLKAIDIHLAVLGNT